MTGSIDDINPQRLFIEGVFEMETYKRSNSIKPLHRLDSGFTLLELMVALALIVAELLAIFTLLISVIHNNKMTELEITGTNVIRRQYEETIAFAKDNQFAAQGTAKGLIFFLREMIDKGIASGPGKVVHDAGRGVIEYEFNVPESGAASLNSLGNPNNHELTRGTMTVYLREDNIPVDFFTWSSRNALGGLVPSGLIGFDMDDDGTSTGDFTSLLHAGAAGSDIFATSPLRRVPVQIKIDFYKNQERMLANAPYYSTDRNYIINDDAIVGTNALN